MVRSDALALPWLNNVASPNRRLRFSFAVSRKFDYPFCGPPSLSAAVGDPQR